MKNSVLLTALIFFSFFSASAHTKGNESDSLKLLSVYKTKIPDPSGLVYYPANNSLLSVSDKISYVYEISLTGKILNKTKVKGKDLEGIALSKSQDTLFLAEEGKKQISCYTIEGKYLSSFKVPYGKRKNHSVEGVTVDRFNRIAVINEKEPCALLIYSNGKLLLDKKIEYAADLSDICYDKESDCFWILSDESAALMKVSLKGNLLKSYSIPFTKGEGVAVIKNKIYIINDSNSRLYIFQKPRK